MIFNLSNIVNKVLLENSDSASIAVKIAKDVQDGLKMSLTNDELFKQNDNEYFNKNSKDTEQDQEKLRNTFKAIINSPISETSVASWISAILLVLPLINTAKSNQYKEQLINNLQKIEKDLHNQVFIDADSKFNKLAAICEANNIQINDKQSSSNYSVTPVDGVTISDFDNIRQKYISNIESIYKKLNTTDNNEVTPDKSNPESDKNDAIKLLTNISASLHRLQTDSHLNDDRILIDNLAPDYSKRFIKTYNQFYNINEYLFDLSALDGELRKTILTNEKSKELINNLNTSIYDRDITYNTYNIDTGKKDKSKTEPLVKYIKTQSEIYNKNARPSTDVLGNKEATIFRVGVFNYEDLSNIGIKYNPSINKTNIKVITTDPVVAKINNILGSDILTLNNGSSQGEVINNINTVTVAFVVEAAKDFNTLYNFIYEYMKNITEDNKKDTIVKINNKYSEIKSNIENNTPNLSHYINTFTKNNDFIILKDHIQNNIIKLNGNEFKNAISEYYKFIQDDLSSPISKAFNMGAVLKLERKELVDLYFKKLGVEIGKYTTITPDNFRNDITTIADRALTHGGNVEAKNVKELQSDYKIIKTNVLKVKSLENTRVRMLSSNATLTDAIDTVINLEMNTQDIEDMLNITNSINLLSDDVDFIEVERKDFDASIESIEHELKSIAPNIENATPRNKIEYQNIFTTTKTKLIELIKDLKSSISNQVKDLERDTLKSKILTATKDELESQIEPNIITLSKNTDASIDSISEIISSYENIIKNDLDSITDEQKEELISSVNDTVNSCKDTALSVVEASSLPKINTTVLTKDTPTLELYESAIKILYTTQSMMQVVKSTLDVMHKEINKIKAEPNKKFEEQRNIMIKAVKSDAKLDDVWAKFHQLIDNVSNDIITADRDPNVFDFSKTNLIKLVDEIPTNTTIFNNEDKTKLKELINKSTNLHSQLEILNEVFNKYYAACNAKNVHSNISSKARIGYNLAKMLYSPKVIEDDLASLNSILSSNEVRDKDLFNKLQVVLAEYIEDVKTLNPVYVRLNGELFNDLQRIVDIDFSKYDKAELINAWKNYIDPFFTNHKNAIDKALLSDKTDIKSVSKLSHITDFVNQSLNQIKKTQDLNRGNILDNITKGSSKSGHISHLTSADTRWVGDSNDSEYHNAFNSDMVKKSAYDALKDDKTYGNLNSKIVEEAKKINDNIKKFNINFNTTSDDYEARNLMLDSILNNYKSIDLAIEKVIKEFKLTNKTLQYKLINNPIIIQNLDSIIEHIDDVKFADPLLEKCLNAKRVSDLLTGEESPVQIESIKNTFKKAKNIKKLITSIEHTTGLDHIEDITRDAERTKEANIEDKEVVNKLITKASSTDNQREAIKILASKPNIMMTVISKDDTVLKNVIDVIKQFKNLHYDDINLLVNSLYKSCNNNDKAKALSILVLSLLFAQHNATANSVWSTLQKHIGNFNVMLRMMLNTLTSKDFELITTNTAQALKFIKLLILHGNEVADDKTAWNNFLSTNNSAIDDLLNAKIIDGTNDTITEKEKEKIRKITGKEGVGI